MVCMGFGGFRVWTWAGVYDLGWRVQGLRVHRADFCWGGQRVWASLCLRDYVCRVAGLLEP